MRQTELISWNDWRLLYSRTKVAQYSHYSHLWFVLIQLSLMWHLFARDVFHDYMDRGHSRPKVPAEGWGSGWQLGCRVGAIAEPCCRENTWELRVWYWTGIRFDFDISFCDLLGVGNTTNLQFRELPLPVLKGAFSSFTSPTYIYSHCSFFCLSRKSSTRNLVQILRGLGKIATEIGWKNCSI